MGIMHQVRGLKGEAKALKQVAGLKTGGDMIRDAQETINRVPVAAVLTGKDLLAWLGRREMSIKQFADETGLSRKTVAKYLEAEELPKVVSLAIRGMEAIG